MDTGIKSTELQGVINTESETHAHNKSSLRMSTLIKLQDIIIIFKLTFLLHFRGSIIEEEAEEEVKEKRL